MNELKYRGPHAICQAFFRLFFPPRSWSPILPAPPCSASSRTSRPAPVPVGPACPAPEEFRTFATSRTPHAQPPPGPVPAAGAILPAGHPTSRVRPPRLRAFLKLGKSGDGPVSRSARPAPAAPRPAIGPLSSRIKSDAIPSAKDHRLPHGKWHAGSALIRQWIST